MKNKFDAIIFDMDGVLVTNNSYCLAIQKTVETLLWETRNIKQRVTTDDIAAMKRITGFNNDWDTSYALIELLGNNVSIDEFSAKVTSITPSIRLSAAYQTVKNVFQNYYLGNNFDGFIREEVLLIYLGLLKQLSKKYKLGIATSRPKAEALFAAKYLKLSPTYIPFGSIVTKEDTKREKPYHDHLLEAKCRIAARNPVYVGDTINDVIAAKEADMKSIFVGSQQLGDKQIQNINQLMEVI